MGGGGGGETQEWCIEGEGNSERGLISSRGDVMQCSWVSPSGDDECMNNKIYSETLIENILPTKYLYDRSQCQLQFYKPCSSLHLLCGSESPPPSGYEHTSLGFNI